MALTYAPVLELLKFLKFSALDVSQKMLSFFHRKKRSKFIKNQTFAILYKRSVIYNTYRLYLELKMCGDGGSGTSVLVSILLLSTAMLQFNICVIAVA